MIWYQKHELRPATREAARSWIAMNAGAGSNPVVIPLSPKSAVIEYEQDLETAWVVLFFPKGQNTPLYLSPKVVKRDGNRRLKSRIEWARRNYRLYKLDVERVTLAEL